MIAGTLDSVDSLATKQAMELLRSFMALHFPDFKFRIARVRRPELSSEGRVQPSVLLLQAVEDRDASHWDFVFVVTAAELAGHYSPFCFAALSRPLDAGVFSLSLIDPIVAGVEMEDEQRVELIAKRLSRLMLHALGHLAGLPASQRRDELLFHPAHAGDLDKMRSLDEESVETQRMAFAEVADQRLEEYTRRPTNRWMFSLRAAWINRREILQAIRGARPWQFPHRLSRLTIASVSTVAILLMTAEAWDLGLSQDGLHLALLVLAALWVTTVYVIIRQQLLMRRSRRITEQSVVTAVSALGIVLVGMAVTWTALFGLGSVVSWLLFEPELIVAWAGASELNASRVGWATVFRMNLFTASIGLLIGALGASFESQHYFRHIIFVDEEI